MSVINFTLTQQYLHEIFEYKDGGLFWVKNGKKAGWLNKQDNRYHIRINQKTYKSHRIIFMMFYGFMPKAIDHIDGNPSNNKINNLRQATSSQNNHNQKLKKTNTSGIKGVFWEKSRDKWKVQVKLEKKVVFQKRLDDKELAEFVAIEARNKYHGKFARHS
jgi:hypothetical protein